jgi:hypothetical protein
MKTNLLTLTAVVVVGGIAAATNSAAAAGYYFEATTTTEGGGTGRGGDAMTVRGWIDGANAKIEFEEGGRAGLFQEGGYLLTTNGGEMLYIVNPSEMTYSEIDLDEMLNLAGSVLDATAGIVDIEFSDLSNEKIAEEPGDPILGYATTRYQYRSGYTMSMSVLGFNRSTRNDSEQELWCTDEIDALGFRAWLSPDRMRTGNEGFDELLKAGYQDLDCLPLRSRVTTTMSQQRGKESTTVSTTEVTTLREEASIEPATFELPSDYTSAPLVPDLPLDGSVPEDGADAGDAPRLRLKDLLRR